MLVFNTLLVHSVRCDPHKMNLANWLTRSAVQYYEFIQNPEMAKFAGCSDAVCATGLPRE